MKTQYSGADLEIPKLNKKQREYLTRITDIITDITNAYDLGVGEQIALMMFDSKGWLFDDYVSAIDQFLQDKQNESK